jgi:hypothetical protein
MRTPNRVVRMGWSVSMGISLAAAHATAADAVTPQKLPAVDQISGEATSYVYRMGWDELKPKLEGTQALAVIQDPQVLNFLHGLRDRGKGRGEIGDVYTFVIQAWRQNLVMFGGPPAGQAAAAPAEEREKQEEAGKGPPASREVAFIQPSSAGQAAFRKQFDTLVTAARTLKHPPATVNVAGTSMQVIDLFGDMAPSTLAGWQNDRLIWAVGRESADWALTPPPAGKALADSEMFQKTVGPLLKDQKTGPFALYYYDMRPTWQRLTAKPEGAGWNQVSWRSLDAVAGATFIEGNGYRNRHYWKVGPQRTGLFQYSRESRIDPNWLGRIPAEASGFTTGVWDGWSFIVSVVALAAKMSGEGGDEMLVSAPTQAMMLQPLLGQLGPRYLVYRLPRKYAGFPMLDMAPTTDMVLITDLRDRAAFGQALTQMTAMLPGGGVQKLQILGHEVLAVPLVYLTVYVAPVEKQAIVAFSSQMLRDALENWDKPGPSIVSTPAYQAASKQLLPDACFELYIAPGGFSRAWLDKYLPMFESTQSIMAAFSGHRGSASEPGSEPPAPLMAPRGSDIARHAPEATIISARDDGEGVLFDGRAPVLCTPYYWAYFHSLARFGPPQAGMLQWLQIALMGNAAD